MASYHCFGSDHKINIYVKEPFVLSRLVYVSENSKTGFIIVYCLLVITFEALYYQAGLESTH